MKKYLFMAVAAIAALSSCSNDNEVLNNEKKQGLVFTATMEGISGTRATFDNTAKCAKWEKGDEIIITGVDEEENNPTTALYVASGTSTSGDVTTFVPKNPGKEVSGVFFEAFFPASEEGPESPAVINEEWKKDQFNMPMFALSETTELEFKNLCGVLAITVKDDQLSQVKSIKVSSANRSVSGKLFPYFDVDKDGEMKNLKVALNTSDDPSKTLTVNYKNPVETDASGKVFYVAIPPSLEIHDDEENEIFEYLPYPYKELKIEISDGNGITASMTTKKGADITIERSKIYNITFNATTGTATTKGGAIVNWVQLWDGGPKFAEYNVGASSVDEYGGYYCWGNTNDQSINWDGEVGTDDIAKELWGDNWRMPTNEEFCKLIEINIYTTFKTQDWDYYDGIPGKIFTGLGTYENNSVFFPAAGYYDKSGIFTNPSTCLEGDYWTSECNNDQPYTLYILKGARSCPNLEKGYGISVRAVLNEK